MQCVSPCYLIPLLFLSKFFGLLATCKLIGRTEPWKDRTERDSGPFLLTPYLADEIFGIGELFLSCGGRSERFQNYCCTTEALPLTHCKNLAKISNLIEPQFSYPCGELIDWSGIALTPHSHSLGGRSAVSPSTLGFTPFHSNFSI